MKKSLITLAIVPIFALSACTQEEEQQTYAVPSSPSVTQTADGSLAQTSLIDSYEQAKVQGYSGSIEEWASLSKMYETNPQQAQQVAADSGFSGGEMLLAGLAGAAIGAMAGNAMSSRTNMASNTYSAQRVNDRTNYAYSQPADRDRRTTGGAAPVVTSGSSNTSAVAARNGAVANRPSAMPSATRNMTSAPAMRSTSVAVSRGGFGGAVSSGG